ncbi:MAG: radical SAM protein, partial [Spirochaetales bacterium]|nr:radical SAM protein [Candidatus Physcosoma equi]
SEVFASVSSSLPFVRGLTVSGGECTLYPEFLVEMAEEAHKRKKTLFVDTNGQIDFSTLPNLVEYIDSFMVDLKAHDNQSFLSLVGNPNEHIVENIKLLLEKGKLFEVRTVLVPNAMDMEATVRLGASLIENHPEVRYKLISYRDNGVRSEYLGLRGPTNEELETCLQILQHHQIQDVVVI